MTQFARQSDSERLQIRAGLKTSLTAQVTLSSAHTHTPPYTHTHTRTLNDTELLYGRLEGRVLHYA